MGGMTSETFSPSGKGYVWHGCVPAWLPPAIVSLAGVGMDLLEADAYAIQRRTADTIPTACWR